jgi:hypothetical protein
MLGVPKEMIEHSLNVNTKATCHTLKYLILGCEYLLECVRLSIGFSENFQNFSVNYSHLS